MQVKTIMLGNDSYDLRIVVDAVESYLMKTSNEDVYAFKFKMVDGEEHQFNIEGGSNAEKVLNGLDKLFNTKSIISL